MQQEKGQSRAPDVLDMGTSFAIEGDQKKLLAPYEVASWSDIPASSKAADSSWYADYGGYVAIGYDASKVKVAPTSFKSLLNPAYKHQVAINNNPTEAAAAFDAVWAAALANGGSFGNIAPGIAFFKQLDKAGQLRPGRSRTDHGGERQHADRRLVGLPAGLRDPVLGEELQGRHPV